MIDDPKHGWTDRARRAINSAKSGGSEHLLRALVQERGLAAAALELCGIDITALIAAIDQSIGNPAGSGIESAEDPSIIDDIKRGAADDARALNHNYKGTEHLLLSILNFDASHANRLLSKFNVEYAGAREHICEVLYGTQK